MALALAQYEDFFQLVSGYLYGAKGAPTCMISVCQVGALATHYTTTPRLAMDGLTLKAATATDNLTLKSYSDRLLQTL